MKALFPYSATTRDITVRVAVSFLSEQSDPGRARWYWAYHIRIENAGPEPIQLISREWLILDGRGGRHDVQGEGVIGEQPVIDAGASYDYVNGCPLSTPSGSMEGRYHMIDAAGASFAVAIPRFPLVAPQAAAH